MSGTGPGTGCSGPRARVRAVLIVPVRHHSPAAALQVGRLIRERRPRVVLIEGPSDATDLIDRVLDAGTVPPVALYAYRRRGDDVKAAYYPFCAYSPEYVALQAGREVGAELQFCDVPAAVTLERQERPESPTPQPPPLRGAYIGCATRKGPRGRAALRADVPCEGEGRRATRRVIVPWSVNLAAFESRLKSVWRSLV